MRLLHFADTHLGTETYGRMDPTTGRSTRLADFARCLDRAVEIGLAAEVDAVLFAGDAYRACDPSPTHQQILATALRRFVDAGVPAVMVCGNHDLPVAFGRAHALDIFATLGDGIQVAAKPALHRLATRSGPLQVACLPWPSRALLLRREEFVDAGEEGLREALEQVCRVAVGHLAEQLEPGLPSVLVAHLAVAEGAYSGTERVALGGRDPTLAASELADRRFDYVALGHLHRHQALGPGTPPVVYCGSLERIDFGEAGDLKGVCLVTIDPTASPRRAAYEFVPVPARPFLTIEADLTAAADPTAALVTAIGGHLLDDAVVRVRYRCTDDQQASLDLRAVRAALEPAFLVAALIRERPEPERRARAEVTEHHAVPEALERYLDTRPELADLREEIRQRALNLDRELTEADAAGSED